MADEIDKSGEETDPWETFHAQVVSAVQAAFKEADLAKRDRREQNRQNWDMFYLRGDYSHKIKGQSQEFLPKNALAAQQTVALVKNTLTNFDTWFDVEYIGENNRDPVFSSDEVKKILTLYASMADIRTVISDALLAALHEVLATVKLVSEKVPYPKYVVTGKKGSQKLSKIDKYFWKPCFIVLPFEDYFPDTLSTGKYPKLYEIHQMLVDCYKIWEGTKTEKNPKGNYDAEALKDLAPYDGFEEKQKKKPAKGEIVTEERSARRKQYLLWEYHGTLLDENGMILKDPDGKEMRDIITTVANKTTLIMAPIDNGRWAQCSPFISAPLLRSAFCSDKKALMDAGTSLNKALIEIFNLMLDGGLSSVFGIRQVHADWLENPDELSAGLPPVKTLRVNNLCPPGAKVVETVSTGNVPADSMSMFGLVEGMLTEASLSNQLRQGRLPTKQVRSTEAAIANQSLDNVFEAMAKDFEDTWVEELIRQLWMEILQHMDEFPKDDLQRILGPEKAQMLEDMSPQERFERSALGYKFIVKGMRSIISRAQTFQNLAQLLSVIGARPELLKEFTKDFSMSRLLKQLVESLGIDMTKISLTADERKVREAMMADVQKILAQTQVNAAQEGGGVGAEGESGEQGELPQDNGVSEPGVQEGPLQ